MSNTIKPHLLVVGGTGFIGYHLVLSAKQKGWKVTSLSLSKPKTKRLVKGVNYLNIDITNLKALKKKLRDSFTHVVNLGGYVNHGLSLKEKDKTIKTHFVGLVNLTMVLSKKKIKKFVQIGSSAEYGKAKAPQNENAVCIPGSPYALAKLASTKFVLMLNKNQKFPATVLRFFQVYGDKQDLNRIIPKVINGCLNNEKFPASTGNQVRDFCHINDVVEAIFLALKRNKANGEIFNIGSGRPTKIKNIINQIRKIIGKGRPQFGKIKYRHDENMKVYPNIKKAKSQLKWKPKINFNRGISMVINSYR